MVEFMKLLIVYGTRPEMIKLSEIIDLIEKHPDIQPYYVHTGQHYSYNMEKCFLEQLNFPEPNVNLEIGSGSQAYQVGAGIIKLEEVFLENKPDVVMALGDTNAVFSAALAAIKIHIPFAHVEAGIRSFDRTMPEEINRVLSDQISEYLFAPTEIAVNNLHNEGIRKGIFLTGNTIVEAATRNLKISEKSNILESLNLEPDNYIVLTAHRAENVDNKQKLMGILEGLKKIKERIIYPIHPRTRKKLEEFNLISIVEKNENLKIIDPLGYFDFLKLCSNASILITDSGGIQEECTIFKKPVIVIRENTERPEILDRFGWLTGCNPDLIGSRYETIKNNYNEIIRKMHELPNPFGDGKASKRIISILKSDY